MSLDSIKRDLKDYIEENKASLEAWECHIFNEKRWNPF